MACPFTGDIWAVATCLITDGLKDKPFTKVFAMDPEETPDIAKSIKIAQERNIPIVSVRDYATEPYPTQEIVNEFETGYCRNTVSFMLALAIYLIDVRKEYNDFAVYGVDQDTNNYIKLKPLVTFWLGVATGRGIYYTIPNPEMPQYLVGSEQSETRIEEQLGGLIRPTVMRIHRR